MVTASTVDGRVTEAAVISVTTRGATTTEVLDFRPWSVSLGLQRRGTRRL